MAANLLLLDDRQRRSRLARRHHLAGPARAADVVTVAADIVGFHGTDPATVFLSARARLRKPAGTVAALEDALYVDRRLVRTLCMRRTMFVVPVDLVPTVQAAVTEALVPGERRRTVQMVEQAGIAADGAAWLAAAEAATLAELIARREATGAEMAKAVPALDHQIPVGEGKTWAGTIGRPDTLRPQRQRRADDLGRRAHRRRLGPAPERRGRPSPPRGRRERGGGGGGDSRRRPGGLARPTRITPRFPTPLQKELSA